MNQDSHMLMATMQEMSDVSKGKLDIMVLRYSSLELRNGDWCNLVLLSDAGAKTHIKGSEMHKYAAYHLAHSYYEWIRLHNGVMPEGLDHMEMQLQKTKYYTFQAGQQRP